MRKKLRLLQQKTALYQQITALLLEFNIRVATRNGGLGNIIQGILEDAENDFAMPFRDALNATWKRYTAMIESIETYDNALAQVINEHDECKKLLALEGVGIINAINLYIAIGCGDAGTFKTGRDASACLGLTPVQHSSGGKIKLGSISQRVKNSSLRSRLISGAMTVVIQVQKRQPKTEKERWLKELIERRGKLCAAVALANKTVRTAFALLTQRTEYKAQPLVA